jgi:NADPH2:quinone reductase
VRAWTFQRHGDPASVLALTEAPDPVLGPEDILVEVTAAAVNFADGLIIRGNYQVRPTLPSTPGMELCGRIVGPTPLGTSFAEGDRVVGLPRNLTGAFAQYAAVPATDLFPAPESLDDDHVAALVISYQTAWFALHRRAAVRPGEVVLVHAAAGGVGSATVQLAKAAGATVIGVVGSTEKAAVAQSLGCDVIINRSAEDIATGVEAATGGRGADVVIDPVGGDAFEASTHAIAFEGRVVVIGFASGRFPTVRAEHAMVKNYGILGLHWGLYRSRDPDAVRSVHVALSDLVASGAALPLVGAAHPFEQAVEALASVWAGSSVGRVVLQGPGVSKP